jgi:L-lactate dehydrogenase complex protein LldG
MASNSRENILSALRPLQNKSSPLPALKSFDQSFDTVTKFTDVLKSIGGKVILVRSTQEIIDHIQNDFGPLKRIVSTLPEFSSIAETNDRYTDLGSLHDVDLFILQSTLGVAENGAVWLREQDTQERVLPFIASNVAVIIDHRHIVPTMHHAYQQIGNAEYGFASFIAGPSKTADIEQSLVLGAHGAITMRVFIVQ